jgi:hypothetical protein
MYFLWWLEDSDVLVSMIALLYRIISYPEITPLDVLEYDELSTGNDRISQCEDSFLT